MKANPTVLSTFAAALAFLLFVTSYALAESAEAIQPTTQPEVVTAKTNHPLNMANQQLQQAREYYQKGETDKVKASLEAASKWLQGNPSSNEAIELANEVKQLQNQINNTSEVSGNAISRLWHRSSSLIAHEIEQATKSWNETSTGNKTLKNLIDARMRFSYAEHDLFIIHDEEKARYEIDSTLFYLDKASEVATPSVREKIMALKQDIQELPTNNIRTEEVKGLIESLNIARDAVQKGDSSVSPEIRARSAKIASDIRRLKNDIFLLEKRQQYDSIRKRLQQLDMLL